MTVRHRQSSSLSLLVTEYGCIDTTIFMEYNFNGQTSRIYENENININHNKYYSES